MNEVGSHLNGANIKKTHFGKQPPYHTNRSQNLHIFTYVVLNSSPLDKMANSTDDIFRCIFANEKFCILIKISLKLVPKGPIDNAPVLI